MSRTSESGVPFLDTKYFDFEYSSNGEREVDVQILSSTIYQGKTMAKDQTVFGVNMADRRIKGYPILDPRLRSSKKFTVRYVRGNSEYGKNNFKDNKNGTISDLATNLMWQQSDSEKALAWAQKKNKENYLDYSDWRLPNAKELQSMVDYSRSPQATNSAAINSLFRVSQIEDEGKKRNYPFYWTSTTHEHLNGGNAAVYVCFGEALVFLNHHFHLGLQNY